MNTNQTPLKIDLTLTKAEERELRSRVFSYVQKNAITSPYSTNRLAEKTRKQLSPFRFIRKVGHFLSVFLLIGISSTSFSAAYSLPGDVLYPVKLAQEDIDVRMTHAPSEKIQKQKARLVRRLGEARSLAEKGTLSSKSRADIDAQIVLHADEIQNTAKVVAQENPILAKEVLGEVSISLAEAQVAELEKNKTHSSENEILLGAAKKSLREPLGKIEPILESLKNTTEFISKETDSIEKAK